MGYFLPPKYIPITMVGPVGFDFWDIHGFTDISFKDYVTIIIGPVGIESFNFGDSNYEKLLLSLNKRFFTYG
jgi:hypothetical protein